MNIKERVLEWLSPPFDQDTQNLVKELQKEPEKLEDAFYTQLKFGTGGMRGVLGAGTNRINKYTLGKNTQGLSQFLKNRYPSQKIKAVIAYDCRHQSESLAKTVADIFTANGIYCYLFSNLRPTPELSFAVRHLQAHCGIVLTASHNPPEYNGYKVYGQDGGQLVPPEDEAVIKDINQTSFSEIQFQGNNKLLEYIDQDIDNAYHKALLLDAKVHDLNKDQLKIVFTPIHGTSITALPQVLEKAGYQHIYVVPEQKEPDGNFPTVSSPNPEDIEALDMAVNLARKHDAHIVIGTDPDADRLGIVVRYKENEWFYLNGNQIMIVLTEYLLSIKQSKGELSTQDFIASTIVSSPIIKEIATAYNVSFKSCLTGFKWIAKLIEDHPKLNFIGGGEESFGYLVGSSVRDKDAISASLLVCELAAELLGEGKNIFDFLLECYEKYGLFYERLHSITKKGKEGAQAIEKQMTQLRSDPPSEFGGIKLLRIEDYQTSSSIDFQTQKKHSLDLPKANVLIFILEDESRIALRPSGTEPKIKFYFSVRAAFDSNKIWQEQQKALDEKINRFLNDLV